MSNTIHVIGNGNSCWLFNQTSPGLRITCNLPPFPVSGKVIGTGLVDYKIMKSIADQTVTIPGDWIIGVRPKAFIEQNTNFYIKHARQIKDIYTHLPKYSPSYTEFSCGHFVTHYACSKYSPEEVHLYGFDSMFAFDLRSCTDFYLTANRDLDTTQRLTQHWRNIWPGIFNEFSSSKFVIHSKTTDIKFKLPKNVEITL